MYARRVTRLTMPSACCRLGPHKEGVQMTVTNDLSIAQRASGTRLRLPRMTMQLLAEVGRPLSAQDLFERIKATGQLAPDQLEPTPDGTAIQFERDIYFSLICEVKAGWLKRPRNAWEVT